jgi:hypothetical protein
VPDDDPLLLPLPPLLPLVLASSLSKAPPDPPPLLAAGIEDSASLPSRGLLPLYGGSGWGFRGGWGFRSHAPTQRPTAAATPKIRSL